MKTFLKALKKSNPSMSADKRKRDEICKAAVAQALSDKLDQYPTSVQEDEALLKQRNLAKRHLMAIEVRLGEKVLLQEAISLLQGETTASEEAHHERAAKKAKITA
jgi:SET domain-containing protein 6